MDMAQTGLVSNRVSYSVKNAEASATIPIGSPLALNISGTDDGIGVILPSSSALKSHALLYGVALTAMTAGQTGRAQVYGFVQKILMLLQTRAASSDSWSASTQSQGAILNVDTVNNAFSTSGGTQAKTAFLPWGVLAESSAIAASATATSDTRTVNTGYMKGFVRIL